MRFSAITAACCLISALAVIPLRAATMLANPGFENGVSGWTVPGWEKVVNPAIDHTVVHGGSSCLKLIGQDGFQGSVFQDLDTAPQARSVEMSGWVKTAGIPDNWDVGIFAEFIGADNKWISIATAGRIAGKGGDTDWQRLEGTFEVPPDARILRYELRVRCFNKSLSPPNTGTAWFDDLGIRQLDEQGKILAAQIDEPFKDLAISRNVLRNSDFADGLNGWANADWLPVVHPAVTTTDARVKGGSSLEYVGESGKRGNVYQDVPIADAGASYYISGWVKIKALPPSWFAGLQVEFMAKDKWLAAQTVQTISMTGDWDWTRLQGVVNAPATATTMRVEPVARCGSDNPGTAAFGAVWFSEINAQPLIDQRKPAAVSIYRIQPGGASGVFLTSQRPEITLSLDNTFAGDKDLNIHFDVVDFWNSVVFKSSLPVRLAALSSSDISLKPGAISKTGFYSVHVGIYDGQQMVASQTSAFCVTTPIKHPNTFLGFTQYEGGLTADSRIIGAGVDPLWFGWRTVEPARGTYDFRGTDPALAPFEGGGFRLIGAIDPTYTDESYVTPGWIRAIVQKWWQAHPDYKTNPENAFPPEYYDYWREYVSAVAAHYRGRIKTWQFIREIDWQQDAPGGISNYAKMIKIGSEAIKRIDPTSIVGGIAVGTQDLLAGGPVARKVWDTAGDNLDGLFIHPYTQPCIYAPGQLPVGDEKGGLRQALVAAQKLASEHHKGLVAVDEKGIKVSSTLPVDCAWTKDAATAIARSLIIARSVPSVGWYSCFLKRAEDFSGDAGDPPGAFDYGYWIHGIPRPAVAVFATCARQLDGASASSELQIHRDVTGYVFSKPSGSVAAVWTPLAKDVPIKVILPSGTRLYDLMGDEHVIDKSSGGETTLHLTPAPLFLVSPLAAPRLAAQLSRAACPLPKLVTAARPGSFRTIDVYVANQTPLPITANVTASLAGGARLLKRTAVASAPGGQTTCVSFPVDDNGASGWTGKFSARIETAGAPPLIESSNIDLSPVHRIPSESRQDGDFAKYAKFAPIVLDGPQDVMCHAGPEAARKIWKGPSDLSMKVWLAWDDTNFYFAASVVDDCFVQEQTCSRIFSQDGFQLAFETLANAVPAEVSSVRGLGDDYYQYGIALTKAGPQGYCWLSAKVNAGLAGMQTSFSPSIVRVTPTLTNYEFAIPWNALAPFEPRAGAVMGFNLNYVDADSPSDSTRYWMQLTPGLSEGKDPTVYRQFVLTQ